MEIEFSNQTEQDIIKSADAGDYVSVAKQLAAAILSERPSVSVSKREQSFERLREDAFKQQSWHDFNRFKSAAAIASEQGIGPVKNADDLIFPSWPEGESVDEFIAAAKGLYEPFPDR